MGLSASLLGPRRFSCSEASAANVHHGDPEAEDEIGGEGLTGPHAEDVSSDSVSDGDIDGGSDVDTDIDAEDMPEFEEDDWIDPNYLDHFREPKDVDIILYCEDVPHSPYWTAVAPEWPCAVGVGSSMEQASRSLQMDLLDLKEDAIERKNVADNYIIPLDPCTNHARKMRMGWVHGYYYDVQKAEFDESEKDSHTVVWSKIRV